MMRQTDAKEPRRRMRLPPLPDLPDLTRPRRLVLAALAVTVIVSVYLGVRDGPGLSLGYGDTDDAMRLVLARQLLHGRGWWDQKEMILQPPVGVYLHWSRLLDGGIALMQRILAWFVNWSQAETATRCLWPLLWIFPAATATLLATRKLGEQTASASWAVLIAAVVMVLDQPLYNQFHPGRIDHHNAQMAFFLLAFAGAVQTGPRLWGAALAGSATGLGLAIGLEALVFEAVIGAALALRFVFAADEAARLSRYAQALALSTVAAFLIQTPPWRWSLVACDAIAFNLVAAIVTASGAMVLAAGLTRARHPLIRLLAFAVAGGLAVRRCRSAGETLLARLCTGGGALSACLAAPSGPRHHDGRALAAWALGLALARPAAGDAPNRGLAPLGRPSDPDDRGWLCHGALG